jgi:hypothetical protein
MANIRTALNRARLRFHHQAEFDFQDLAISLGKSIQEASTRKQPQRIASAWLAVGSGASKSRNGSSSRSCRDVFPPFPHRTGHRDSRQHAAGAIGVAATSTTTSSSTTTTCVRDRRDVNR